VHVDKVPVAIGELHVRVALGDQVLDGVLGKVLDNECHVIFATVEAKDGDLGDLIVQLPQLFHEKAICLVVIECCQFAITVFLFQFIDTMIEAVFDLFHCLLLYFARSLNKHLRGISTNIGDGRRSILTVALQYKCNGLVDLNGRIVFTRCQDCFKVKRKAQWQFQRLTKLSLLERQPWLDWMVTLKQSNGQTLPET